MKKTCAKKYREWLAAIRGIDVISDECVTLESTDSTA
jgi:hypothetical protein